MDTLLRFGEGTREYTFVPDDQINLATNFADLVPQTSRLPGTSGGFNQFGNEPLPSEVGSINYSFWMYFASVSAAVTARDNLMAVTDWGLQKLFMLPQNDSAQGERWTWATVNNVSANFNSQSLNHVRMRVTMTFQVPDPFWYSAEESELEYYVSSTPTTLSLTVGGSVRTAPVVSIYSDKSGVVIGTAGVFIGDLDVLIGAGGSSIVNPNVVRIESGVETHRMNYTGTLANTGERLVIDCRAETVEENGSNAWGNITRTRAEMLRLRPGANSVKIEGAVTGTLRVNFRFYETWR